LIHNKEDIYKKYIIPIEHIEIVKFFLGNIILLVKYFIARLGLITMILTYFNQFNKNQQKHSE